MKPARVSSCLTLVALLSSPASADPAWTYQSSGKVAWLEVTPLGSVAVVSEAGVTVLDPATGAALWSHPELQRFDTIDGTPFAVVRTKDAAQVVQLENGTPKWKFADTGVSEKTGFISYPNLGLLVLIDRGTPVPTLVGTDVETGAVRWKQAALVDAAVPDKSFMLVPYHLPLQDTDSTVIFYPSSGGPVRMHLGTGNVMWRAQDWGKRKGAEAHDMTEPSPLVRDANLVLAPYAKRLIALDADDGHIVWDHAENFQTGVAQIRGCAPGILVRGGGKPFVRMLDRATGKEIWQIPFKTVAPVTSIAIQGEKAYAAGEKKLAEITLASGDTRILNTFEFKGDEVPVSVEPMDSGVLLASSQNLLMVDSTGAQRYQRYLKAPGASFLAKLASTTLMLGFNVVSMGVAGGGPAPIFTNNPILTMRYRASANAARYAYIFTSAPDATGHEGFSLVRIDKGTGEEAGRLWIDDRSPKYRLDAITGTVYLLRDDREVLALRY